MDVMMRMNIVNIVLYLLLLLPNIDNTLQLSLSKEGCYFQHFIIHPAKKKEKKSKNVRIFIGICCIVLFLSFVLFGRTILMLNAEFASMTLHQ